MRILQVLPTLSYGDAIGNDVLALKTALKDMGYDTQVYAEYVAPVLGHGTAEEIKRMPQLREDDIIIYHLSIGTPLNYDLPRYKAKKIVIYHNITPPKFFRGYDSYVESVVKDGLKGVDFLADKVDYCFADSEFNKQDLIAHGYSVPIDVLPILIPFDDYKKTPNQDVMTRYKDGKHNIVFTGRVAPNKCHHDIIAAFACYKKFYDPEARLFLVGTYGETETYYKKLKSYVSEIGVDDVIFTGHVKFDEILAYYQVADVFLCMSEHEGFCVPLVEAMFFGIPIIAYNCTAVPETLGEGGILTDSKDPVEAAALINRVITDRALRDVIRENQQRRIEDFKYEKIIGMFKEYLNKFLKTGR